MTSVRTTKAKINLTLQITGKRGDGYHLLHSLVAFADVGDQLSCEVASTNSLKVDGPFSSGLDSENNLVLRAAALLGVETASFVLQKNLPVASGIGGGSGDAAAALHLLNDVFALRLSDEALARHALALGADVPSCLSSRACWMRGIGEDIVPIAAFPDLPAVLVHPGMACPTADVFAGIDLPDASLPAMQTRFDRDSLDAYLTQHGNDLQQAAIERVPIIADVLEVLAETGTARHVRMSGSGATCFGLFGNRRDADAAAEAINRFRPEWWAQAATLS